MRIGTGDSEPDEKEEKGLVKIVGRAKKIVVYDKMYGVYILSTSLSTTLLR